MSIAAFVALGAAGVPGFTAFVGKTTPRGKSAYGGTVTSPPVYEVNAQNARALYSNCDALDAAVNNAKPARLQVNFAVSREDAVLIARIMDRCETAGITTPASRFTHQMDLTACHANGCPLRLQHMLEWDRDFDIAHDISGLNLHLDRSTGKLRDFFVPRFAA